MIIYVIREYLKLADLGIVPPVVCDIDPDHGKLYTNMDDDDRIFLYCLACDFKIKLGINSLQDITKSVALALW